METLLLLEETDIESIIGLLIPPPPWTGRLVAASAKAISIIHPDGAMISVVGRPQDMEARALMPAEGFSGFSARAAGVLENVIWDGKQLSLLLSGNETGPGLYIGEDPVVWDPRERLAKSAQCFLDCRPSNGAVSGVRSARGFVAAEVRSLLTEAYAAGRRAEGLHGTGAFAQGFRRLEAHPDFPAVAVGFGPGTTPAGDDWLAGCLVALDLRAGGPGKAAVPLRQKIRDRLEQTTAAGRALLLGAVSGAPPEYLVGLAEAAAGYGQGLAGLRGAVSNCLTHGATSGEDALAGFVYGLEVSLG